MLPLPSIAQLKVAFETAMKVIGFIKEKVEEFEPKQWGSSELTLYRPSKDEVVEKLLHGKFPRIPGTYDVEINGRRRIIQVEAIVVDMNVSWEFRDKGEFVWWAFPEADIQATKWNELLDIKYT